MSMMVNSARFSSGAPFSQVVFLAGFEGVDASTAFVDESSYARAVTAQGNAQIDTAQFKYGASSLLVDGTGDWAQCANSADWNFGAGQFTIECFLRYNQQGGFAAEGAVLSQWADSQRGWMLRRILTGPGFGVVLGLTASTDTTVSGNFTFTNGVWYHVACDRDAAGKVRVYVGGAMIASATVSAALYASNQPMMVGNSNFAAFNRAFDGWIDEVRITKGTARYASDSGFTPPTAAFPRS